MLGAIRSSGWNEGEEVDTCYQEEHGTHSFDVPAYHVAEAARYIGVAAPTLRRWFDPSRRTRSMVPALLIAAASRPAVLSFANLVDAYLVAAFRTRRGVMLDALAEVIAEGGVTSSFAGLGLSSRESTSTAEELVDRYCSGVGARLRDTREISDELRNRLGRVEWSDAGCAMRLRLTDDGGVVIDPEIGFGRPILQGGGVSIDVLSDRIDAGEAAADVAREYGIGEIETRLSAEYQL